MGIVRSALISNDEQESEGAIVSQEDADKEDDDV
jgi:hypothetical protein